MKYKTYTDPKIEAMRRDKMKNNFKNKFEEIKNEIKDTEKIIQDVLVKIQDDLTPFSYELIKNELDKDLMYSKAKLQTLKEATKLFQEMLDEVHKKYKSCMKDEEYEIECSEIKHFVEELKQSLKAEEKEE